MEILGSLFGKKSKSSKSDNCSTSSLRSSKNSTASIASSSSHSRKKKNRSKRQERSGASGVEQAVAALVKTRMELCEEYIRQFNKHDVEGVRAFFRDDFRFVFSDHELTWNDFAGEAPKAFAAFPDLNLEHSHMEEREDGAIILRNLIASGTHTGEPYGFGPCDVIPTTGKYVKNDPEEIAIVFDEHNKMSRHEIVAKGEMTGFAGFYVQIGGFPLL